MTYRNSDGTYSYSREQWAYKEMCLRPQEEWPAILDAAGITKKTASSTCSAVLIVLAILGFFCLIFSIAF